MIASGASTCLVNADLSGSVTIPAGTRFAAVNSTIGGAVTATTATGANMTAICGSRIGGSIVVENVDELVMVGDPAAACPPNSIAGGLILYNNTHGLETIDNTVGGALNTSGNSGPGPYGQPTRTAGNA